MELINPFIPHHPSVARNFVGRTQELRRLQSSLRHTKVGRPVHFMITGERGIGKTSLLNYVRSMALSYGDDLAEPFSFVVVSVQLEHTTTQFDLVRKIELGLRRQLEKVEAGRDLMAKAWAFVQRLEIAGVGLKEMSKDLNAQMFLWEEFAHSLVETATRLCGNPDSGHDARTHDGILILIDEVDTANPAFDIGGFLKFLTEYFQRAECRQIMFGLSGLPSMIDVLLRSHRSSLRVFEEIPLTMLSRVDVDALIDSYLETANVSGKYEFSMPTEAKSLVFNLAEGHPHFIQQCCYNAFNAAETRLAEALGKPLDHTLPIEIGTQDVTRGAFSPRGAIDTIGDIYYRDLISGDLNDPQYRGVMAVVSQYLDDGVTAKEVATLVGIGTARAGDILMRLVDVGILQRSEETHCYRVRHRCFAYWLQNSGRGNAAAIAI